MLSLIQLTVVISISLLVYLLIMLRLPDNYIDQSVSIVVIFLPALFFIYKKDTIRFKKAILQPILNKYAIWGFILFTVLGLINYYQASNNYQLNELAYLNKYTHIGLIFYLLCICCITPIVEEFIFRYYVYYVIKERYGIFVALVISNIIYVGFHGLHENNLYNIALQGIVYTWVFEKSKSINSSIAVHVFNNSIYFLAKYAVLLRHVS